MSGLTYQYVIQKERREKMKYLYNPKTKKLHIKGYCMHATENAVKNGGYLEFYSEDKRLLMAAELLECVSCV